MVKMSPHMLTCLELHLRGPCPYLLGRSTQTISALEKRRLIAYDRIAFPRSTHLTAKGRALALAIAAGDVGQDIRRSTPSVVPGQMSEGDIDRRCRALAREADVLAQADFA